MVVFRNFIPTKDADKTLWLNNLANKLPNYATKYEISADDTADMEKSALYFAYLLNLRQQNEDYGLKLTAYKDELRDGNTTNGNSSVLPTPPVIDNPPTAVAPGIFVRATAIAQRIKKHRLYTDSDGKDLGLVADKQKRDLNSVKPNFTVRLTKGGQVEIVWLKQGMDGIEIYADYNNSGHFAFVDFKQRPNSIDKHPLPAANESAIWRYRLIYRYHDEQVGLFSDIVSIAVSGNV